ncbi:hypothetical protein OJAV_G00121340 [Oryzias javanicus]|uniref:Protein kinase domain-containing protein n=1 Tax=Oryzias javanicus TaxID=123683 RepID=A0A3S2M1B6_ORYJA|nr:hypothetical protein OJAV_G00121340 [Oryzias javanicus]
MALTKPKLFGNDDLDKWKEIGSGGFSSVYRVKHRSMGHDLAIKFLRPGVSGNIEEALFVEAKHLEEFSSDYVLRLYGLYQGIPPLFPGMSPQKGIVMEFMQRGSIETLQKTLSGPPPLPLAFRLAHEVALGMNFLHSKRILHRDLKPSNVMLNDNLNSKLADFGLCTYSTSASNVSTDVDSGGTLRYTPPEAFDVNYKPVRSFDLYSYGILLWTILSGQEPYRGVWPCIVTLKVPQGDRPAVEDIQQKDAEGMKELLDLMKKCWDGEPFKRPTFKECVEITERGYLMHRRGIYEAVFGVLKRLDVNCIESNETNAGPSLICSEVDGRLKSRPASSGTPSEKTESKHRRSAWSLKEETKTESPKKIDQLPRTKLEPFQEKKTTLHTDTSWIRHPTANPTNKKTNTSPKLETVSGKRKCTFCDMPLGKGAAMIIESLGQIYHLHCFKCFDCKRSLESTEAENPVRIKDRQLYCTECYKKATVGKQQM